MPAISLKNNVDHIKFYCLYKSYRCQKYDKTGRIGNICTSKIIYGGKREKK